MAVQREYGGKTVIKREYHVCVIGRKDGGVAYQDFSMVTKTLFKKSIGELKEDIRQFADFEDEVTIISINRL